MQPFHCSIASELGRNSGMEKTYAEYHAGVGDKRRGPAGRSATVIMLALDKKGQEETYW